MTGPELEIVLRGVEYVGSLVQGLDSADSLLARYGRIRRSRVETFLEELSNLSEHDRARMADAIADNDVVAELFERGAQAASETAAVEKRWHLARVVAAAFRGDGFATPDELRLLLRTVVALEPAEVQLLVVIAGPHPGIGQLAGSLAEGFLTIGDLERLWPEAAPVFDPLLSALQREGLVRAATRTYATSSGIQAWGLTSYGRQFLRFLPGGPYEVPTLNTAVLDVRLEVDGMGPVVRNLGLATAEGVELSVYRTTEAGGVVEGSVQVVEIEIPAGDAYQMVVTPPTLGTERRLHIALKWNDEKGTSETHRTWDELPLPPV